MTDAPPDAWDAWDECGGCGHDRDDHWVTTTGCKVPGCDCPLFVDQP